MNKHQKKILVTGASGFIGESICLRLSEKYTVFGTDNKLLPEIQNIITHFLDITDYENFSKFVQIHKPDIIVHCAGIAHQKIKKISRYEYININSIATEHIANIAAEFNHGLHFIFLSSISIYGEEKTTEAITEEHVCNPSSDYAYSKLSAEKRLRTLYESGKLKKLDILRLAPVSDHDWSLNLDRRVFFPKKITYLKFGSGLQEMSAVSRQNLVEFIEHRINQEHEKSAKSSFCNILNICDEKPYKFIEIIKIFQKSCYQPKRVVITVPLSLVWIVTRFSGLIFKKKRQWLFSCYNKLANNLIFNNEKMLATGFKPVHTLKTIFKE